MKALRLILHQNSANYKKEETVDNKMTYPLPPISTIIGALHSICGYQEYKPMDISIQGKYESMHRKPYTDYCFLNSVQDDRGILVKMRNGSLLSKGFDKVATAKKTQGNSFRLGITIHVDNQELLDEYRALKDLNDKIGEFKKVRFDSALDLLKRRKKQLSNKKKDLSKNTPEYERVVRREKELKETEREIKKQFNQYVKEKYTTPVSYYRSLTKSLKYYEILDGVTLVLHIKAEENILKDILEHIYDLRSIGRSEDTVSVENAEIVELQESAKEGEVESKYAAYIDWDMVKNENVYLREKKGKISGTRYYLNKNYKIVKGQRQFEKKKVLYVSQYSADTFGSNLFVDTYRDETYIVTFL